MARSLITTGLGYFGRCTTSRSFVAFASFVLASPQGLMVGDFVLAGMLVFLSSNSDDTIVLLFPLDTPPVFFLLYRITIAIVFLLATYQRFSFPRAQVAFRLESTGRSGT
jgi:hypothetical protein